jgi:hypothetical protein
VTPKLRLWNEKALDLALTIAVLFVAILVTYYGADWWELEVSSIWPRGRLFLLRSSAALLLAVIATSLCYWLASCGKRARIIFIAWLTAAAALFAVIWPGYLMSDSVSAIKYSLEFPFDLWLGLFTPFFNSAILQLVPHIWALSAAQLLIAAAILAYASETIILVTGKRRYALVFAVLILASPALIYNLGLLARDTLFSLVSLWLVAFLVRLGNRLDVSPALMLLAGIASGLTATIRGVDGWFVLVPLLAIVPWLVKDKRLVGIYAATAFATVGLFNYVLTTGLGRHGDEFKYAVANTVNPLGYILQNKFSTDYGKNLEAISKVVTVEKIRAEQTPYEIPAWWSGGVILPNVMLEDQAVYTRHVGAYLRENIAVFLAGRVHTFSAATGLSEKGFKMDDMYRANWPSRWIPPQDYHIDLTAGRPFPVMFDRLKTWFDRSAEFNPRFTSGSAIFWNILPWLALLLIVMLTRRHGRALRLAVVIVVARVPIVFLGAPASQFKYYLPVMLCGAFVLAMALPAWLEMIRRRGSVTAAT